MDWSGRVVLISGASSGIGAATARRFASLGAQVIGLARRAEALESLQREFPDRIRVEVADVTDGPRMAELCAGLLDEGIMPDLVVANAGIGLDAAFTNMSDEDVRRVFDVNVLGVVRTVRPFLAPMVARGHGRLLWISSIVGKRGTPYYAAYSGSKFALHGMADSLRAELHGTGVSLGLVCPSSTLTDFQDNALRRGPGQKKVRPRRHSVDSVVDAIVRMAGSRRREVVLGAEAKLMVWVNRIAPGWLDGFLARILRNKAA